MPNWNPNSAKHKAAHGNYYSKPTKKEVQANLDFWSVLSSQPTTPTPTPTFPKLGAQLKLAL